MKVRSIRSKVLIAITGITLLTAAAMAFVFYGRSSRMIEENYITVLSQRTRLLTDTVDDMLKNVCNIDIKASCDKEIKEELEQYLNDKDEKRLIDLAEHILNCWRGYTDEDAFVFAETDGEPHNTITPIARKVGDTFELDLALRNNITTDECPLGVYHPHAQYHHIKKENIGLIEVMGLAVLPARLKDELELLAEYLVEKKDPAENESLKKHADWVKEFLPKYEEITKENVMGILEEEVGQVFVKVLEDAGVYKCTKEGRDAFKRFISVL